MQRDLTFSPPNHPAGIGHYMYWAYRYLNYDRLGFNDIEKISKIVRRTIAILIIFNFLYILNNLFAFLNFDKNFVPYLLFFSFWWKFCISYYVFQFCMTGLGEYRRREGCTKFELGCTKCVKNYGVIFFQNLTMMRLRASSFKFLLWIPAMGRGDKIWTRLYKIVRNVYKFTAPFLFWNSKIVRLRASSPPNLNIEYCGRGGCTKFELGCTKLYETCTKLRHHFNFEFRKWWGYMPPALQIWIANTAEGERVQNSSSFAQNCTKCVQNYGTIFILIFENGGAGGVDLILAQFVSKIFRGLAFERQKFWTKRHTYKIWACFHAEI